MNKNVKEMPIRALQDGLRALELSGAEVVSSEDFNRIIESYHEGDPVLYRRRVKADIDDAVASLPPGLRERVRLLPSSDKDIFMIIYHVTEGLQAKDVAEIKGCSRSWVARVIVKLVEAGLVKRIGSRKTGAYVASGNSGGDGKA